MLLRGYLFVVTGSLGLARGDASDAGSESGDCLNNCTDDAVADMITGYVDIFNETVRDLSVFISTLIDRLEVIKSLGSVTKLLLLTPDDKEANKEHNKLDGGADGAGDSCRRVTAVSSLAGANAEENGEDAGGKEATGEADRACDDESGLIEAILILLGNINITNQSVFGVRLLTLKLVRDGASRPEAILDSLLGRISDIHVVVGEVVELVKHLALVLDIILRDLKAKIGISRIESFSELL